MTELVSLNAAQERSLTLLFNVFIHYWDCLVDALTSVSLLISRCHRLFLYYWRKIVVWCWHLHYLYWRMCTLDASFFLCLMLFCKVVQIHHKKTVQRWFLTLFLLLNWAPIFHFQFSLFILIYLRVQDWVWPTI